MIAKHYRTVPEREAWFAKLAQERRMGATFGQIGCRWGLSASRVWGIFRYERILEREQHNPRLAHRIRPSAPFSP